ncbi:MAG TPA: carbohydrate ABC transporter permease, partial [bacterium]
MKSKRHLKKYATSISLHTGMLVVSAITLLPFLWMVSASFMKSGEASSFPPRFFPHHFTFDQYLFLFQRINVGRFFVNSLILAVSVSIVSLFVNSLAGYAFAKFSFRAKRPLFVFLLSSMIIPGQVTMLPVFLLLNKLGLL